MEGKLPIGVGSDALDELSRPTESRAPARQDVALGRREMNVAVMKTKVEQALTENFAAVEDRLAGGADVREVRDAAIGRFGALGLPNRRVEAWKYTDLRNALKEALPLSTGDKTPVKAPDVTAALGPLAAIDAHQVVFVNGAYRKDLSKLEAARGIDVASLAEALSSPNAAEFLSAEGRDDDPVLALNAAYATDGAVVRVADEAKLDKPLLLLFVRAGTEPCFTAARNVVSVGKGANVTLIEVFVTLPGASQGGQENMATKISVGEGASVAQVKCTIDAVNGTHLANWLVDLSARATYNGFYFTSGCKLVRNQIGVAFKGENAQIDISGTFLVRGSQHVDTTLVVDHAVPHGTSRELFKGVLEDQGRGVFQGKVIVQPDAQKTDGKQMAQVLMLSPDAEFDSKPELEIYADDVVCGHGSTSADLDEELLFYCRSRGIPEAQARALLIESFIGEAIEKVEREDVREALAELARQWLAEGGSAKGT
jgi:Fe-S cluster assembly protein SufD